MEEVGDAEGVIVDKSVSVLYGMATSSFPS